MNGPLPSLFIVLTSINSMASEISPPTHNSCTPMTLSEWNTDVASKKNSTKLIFFSTWCADCKYEIEKYNNQKNNFQTILIAEFDEINRVNKNLNKMHINLKCVFDLNGDIRKKYGVVVVPTEITTK